MISILLTIYYIYCVFSNTKGVVYETILTCIQSITQLGFISGNIWLCLSALVIVFFLTPFLYFPLTYPWQKYKQRKNTQCKSCNQPWTVYLTGESDFLGSKNKSRGYERNEYARNGDRRTVAGVEYYKVDTYDHYFQCKNCKNITTVRSSQSTNLGDNITAYGGWQKNERYGSDWQDNRRRY